MVLPVEVHPVRNSSGALDHAELFRNVTLLQPPARREQRGNISNAVNIISYGVLGSTHRRPVRRFGVLDFKMKSEVTVLP